MRWSKLQANHAAAKLHWKIQPKKVNHSLLAAQYIHFLLTEVQLPWLHAGSLAGYNQINVIDFKTKEEHVKFQGARNSNLAYTSLFQRNRLLSECLLAFKDTNPAYLREISNTGLLASLYLHTSNSRSNLAVFDVSQKGKARNIFTFEGTVESKSPTKLLLFSFE